MPLGDTVRRAVEYLQSHPGVAGMDVPQSLVMSCGDVNVYQFMTNPQVGVTCGNHAAFNAIALRALVNSGEELSSNNLRRVSAELLGNHQQGGSDYLMCDDDITGLLKTFVVRDARIVSYDPALNSFYTAAEIDDEPDISVPLGHESIIRLDEFYQKIRSSDAMLAQFILHAGGHWVAISVLKYDYYVDIIYMDSVNAPLTEGSISYQYIMDLCKKLAPYD